MSAAVVSTSVIGSAATRIQCGRGLGGRQRADLVAERPRVGEEQRRVEAEDHEAGQLLAVGVHLGGRGSRPGRGPGRGWSGTAARRDGTR